MRCGHADISWEYYVFDLGVNVSEICLFLCSSSMRYLWYKFFHF